MTADHRSANPNFPGVPWWGAVLLAITATAIGFAFDAGSGSKELSTVFGAAYVIGCLLAVLVVRQAGLFTAVIQPPLILFIAVPTSYFLFRGGEVGGVKDILINCGYPLIERFPLMFFTSAAVLLIGAARWYYGLSTRRASARSAEKETKITEDSGPSLASTVTSKMSSLFSRGHDAEDEFEEPPRRRRTADAANRRSTKRPTTSRSRHTRPPETEVIPSVTDRPRRTRSSRPAEPLPGTPVEPRRKPRSSSAARKAVPPPAERRSGYERERERAERRRRFDDYQPREPHGSNGNGTHHPVSRVRYRGGAEDNDERTEYRSRRRTPRNADAESWEYDV